MDRVDSGETDDSPFSSNLVTPTDDQIIPGIVQPRLYAGLDEKILMAKASLDYFTSGRTDVQNDLKAEEDSIELDTTITEAPASIALSKPEPQRVSISQSSESQFAEDGVFLQVYYLRLTATHINTGHIEYFNFGFQSDISILSSIRCGTGRSSSALF
jgi:hypothetical protein